jgi:hypothetical protein
MPPGAPGCTYRSRGCRLPALVARFGDGFLWRTSPFGFAFRADTGTGDRRWLDAAHYRTIHIGTNPRCSRQLRATSTIVTAGARLARIVSSTIAQCALFDEIACPSVTGTPGTEAIAPGTEANSVSWYKCRRAWSNPSTGGRLSYQRAVTDSACHSRVVGASCGAPCTPGMEVK